MEKYEEELYIKLTARDSFKQLMKLRSFYDDVVKPEIARTFWEEVLGAVNEQLSTNVNLKQWKVWMNWESGKGIYLNKHTWVDNEIGEGFTPISITWDQLDGKTFYGVFFEHKFTKIDFEAWRSRFVIPPLKYRFKEKDKNYLIWHYYNNYDFEAADTLQHFLPEYQKEQSAVFAQVLIDIGIAFEEQIDDLMVEYFELKKS